MPPKRKASQSVSNGNGSKRKKNSPLEDELRAEEEEEHEVMEVEDLDNPPVAAPAENDKQLPALLRTKYFKIKSGPAENGDISVICTLCIGKTLKGNVSSTGNFRKHIKNAHPSQCSAVEEAISKLQQEQPRTNSSKGQSSSSTSPGFSSFFRGRSACVTQEEANRAITGYIVNQMEPVSVVEAPSFRNLVGTLTKGNPVSINSPTRKTVNNIISDKYEEMMTSIKGTLQESAYVSTTADIWSSRNRSYMGVTAHTIVKDTLERLSFAVACRRIKYSHNFKNIANVISSVNKDLGIDGPSKIVNCVTDNASNFAKAFRIYNPSSNQSESEVEDMVGEGDDDEEISFPDLDFSEVQMVDALDILSDDYVRLPPQKRCFPHTLNLVMKTDSDVQNIPSTGYKRLYNSAFSKVTAFWNLGSRSTKASDRVVEVAGVKFPVPNQTRWNAYPDAIAKLLDKKENLEELFTTLQIAKLKPIELEFFTEYLRVTEPIATGLDILQGDEYCYFGIALPTLLVINKKMSQISNLRHCEPLLESIKAGVEKRFEYVLDINRFSSEEFFVAAITMPQFKLHFLRASYSPEEVEKAQNVFIKACEESKAEMDDEQDENSLAAIQHDQAALKNTSMPTKIANFFSDLSPGTAAVSRQNAARLEALRYLEDEEQGYAMLHRYPIVKRVFLKYNVTLPSSAPVERLFSSGGQILVPRRARLGDRNFENQLLLKANKYLT